MTTEEHILRVLIETYPSAMTQLQQIQAESLISGIVPVMQARLRKNVQIDDIQRTFCLAAALAVWSLLETMEDGALTSFDAGTLSLTFDRDKHTMMQTARALLAPWCDTGTAFVGVRV